MTNTGVNMPTACLLLMVCCLALTAGRAFAEAGASGGGVSAPGRDEVDQAVDRAVEFLLRQQDEDGSICDTGSNNSTAMTSLAIMAMAAVGHQPTDEDEAGRAMRRAIEYVLRRDRVDERGYFGKPDGSRMYGHGITTLMLSEILGMGVDDDMDRRIYQRLERAIDVILRAQRHSRKRMPYIGGWRYEPDASDADLSLTVWQLMALRSAKNAGLDVPKQAIDDAIDYLRRSYVSSRNREGQATNLLSGFTYQPGRGEPRFSNTAMGLLAMQVCGQYEEPEVVGSANWLLANPPNFKERWFFYGLYYYAQGMNQRGGQFAREATERVRRILLNRQGHRGDWIGQSSERSAGRVYTTSLGILSLSVKYHYLPIYQGGGES